VAKAIRADARTSSIPIVLLTSVYQIDFARLVLDYGISAHLTKPARSAALFATVVSTIQKARSKASRPALMREAVQPIPLVQRADRTIAEDGTVGQVDVLSSVHPALDAAAVAAVKTWRFEPAQRCGKPAAATYRVARRFELGD
jgi:TonB family protein